MVSDGLRLYFFFFQSALFIYGVFAAYSNKARFCRRVELCTIACVVCLAARQTQWAGRHKSKLLPHIFLFVFYCCGIWSFGVDFFFFCYYFLFGEWSETCRVALSHSMPSVTHLLPVPSCGVFSKAPAPGAQWLFSNLRTFFLPFLKTKQNKTRFLFLVTSESCSNETHLWKQLTYKVLKPCGFSKSSLMIFHVGWGVGKSASWFLVLVSSAVMVVTCGNVAGEAV